MLQTRRHPLLHHRQPAQQIHFPAQQSAPVQLRPGVQLGQRVDGPGRAVPLPDVEQLDRAFRAVERCRPPAGLALDGLQSLPPGRAPVWPILRRLALGFQQSELVLGEGEELATELAERFPKKRWRSSEKRCTASAM